MSGRREFLRWSAGVLAMSGLPDGVNAVEAKPSEQEDSEGARAMKLFLCGDVMLGRGIEQILEHPSDPVLYEPYMESALGYVELAEEVNGKLPRRVASAYVWGDALDELARRDVDLRIINLETSVTRSDEPWPKGINYRMHPDNVGCLTAASIDCCVLSNNHVLDWEQAGLAETLSTLERAQLRSAGAGKDIAAAEAPAILSAGRGGRVLVFGAATGDSGVPTSWAAGTHRPGVHRLPDLSQHTVRAVAENVRRHARPGDRVIFSVHWGDNWGYDVSADKRTFAHRLIDEAGVHLVHGHSSHHVRPIEVYRSKLIMYGAGDFLNDYEGIRGHEDFRGELGLMYFPKLDVAGALVELTMTPTCIRHFRVNRADEGERRFLIDTLNRIGVPFGTGVEGRSDGALVLRWS